MGSLRQSRGDSLSGVALLERIGWIGEAESESIYVFGSLGLNPMDARKTVDDLHRRYGIAPLAGRFRYVSPQILADHLAARQLSAWTADHFREFISKLTTPMAESFARRLCSLSSVLANRATVEEVILGDQGPFCRLGDLEEGHLRILLRYLAGPFRHAALRALRRIIDSATDAQLLAATSSRRDLVWSLEELLWPEDTFAEAARLLLRLAVTENESIGNNATGLFVETFQVSLGRTAAGPPQRLQVLEEAIKSPSIAGRVLAAKALGRATAVSHIHRMGAPPSDIPGMPTESWRPTTWGELWRTESACVHALEPLLVDREEVVRLAAAEALSEGIEAAIKFPGVLEAWIAAAKRVIQDSYEIRKPLLTKLQWRLDRYAGDTNEDDLPKDVSEKDRDEVRTAINNRIDELGKLFRELKGDDFSSRFRWTLSSDPWRPSLRAGTKGGDELSEVQANLATEVLARPELFAGELEWLLSLTGHMPEIWIERLAKQDTHRVLWERLLEVSRSHERGIGWVTLYTLAQVPGDADPGAFDAAMEAIANAGAGPLQLFDLLIRAGLTPNRLERLVSLFATGTVAGRFLRRVTFSEWRDRLSTTDVARLVESVFGSLEGQEASVSFLSFYLHSRPDAAKDLGVVALRVLEATAEHAESHAGTLDDWAEVAKHVAKTDPYGVTGVALKRLGQENHFLNDGISEVLLEAWRIGDKKRLFDDFYAARVEGRDIVGFRLRLQLEKFPIAEVGDDDLIAWVAAKPETRAYTVAQMIGRPIGRPSALHAALLERFPGHGVGDAFLSDIISGTWWGSASERTRGLIHEAKQWVDDDRPAVKLWAEGAVVSLEEMLKRDEIRDAEERFR